MIDLISVWLDLLRTVLRRRCGTCRGAATFTTLISGMSSRPSGIITNQPINTIDLFFYYYVRAHNS